MISFRDLSEADRRLLAQSQFGNLKAREIPANWKEFVFVPQSKILRHHDVLHEIPKLLGAKR